MPKVNKWKVAKEDSGRTVLLSVADGPESIEIYTSEDEAIVDWCAIVPALYITATVHDAYIKLGPFCLKSIRDAVLDEWDKMVCPDSACGRVTDQGDSCLFCGCPLKKEKVIVESISYSVKDKE